jgi:hypothetical protein
VIVNSFPLIFFKCVLCVVCCCCVLLLLLLLLLCVVVLSQGGIGWVDNAFAFEQYIVLVGRDEVCYVVNIC